MIIRLPGNPILRFPVVEVEIEPPADLDETAAEFPVRYVWSGSSPDATRRASIEGVVMVKAADIATDAGKSIDNCTPKDFRQAFRKIVGQAIRNSITT